MSKCIACGKNYKVNYGSKDVVCSLQCWGAVKTKLVPGSPHPTGKGGKRHDLGSRYFRSRWEANWARYLNWLQAIGEIQGWEYEVDTFEFAGIKRGTRFYTPDFKVTNKDGSIVYHEIKGWMDKRSQVRMRRMKKYHPEVVIEIIDETQYRAVASKVARVIAGWETDLKKGF